MLQLLDVLVPETFPVGEYSLGPLQRWQVFLFRGGDFRYVGEQPSVGQSHGWDGRSTQSACTNNKQLFVCPAGVPSETLTMLSVLFS